MTVAFKTFGCRLNRAEMVEFSAAFAEAGIGTVPLGEEAEIIVLHTCAVTRPAEEECVKLLRKLRRLRADRFLVVTGCAVESVTAEGMRAAGADMVVARADKDDLARLVAAEYVKCRGGSAEPLATAATPRRYKRFFLKIQDGCDFFCAYCIIPHTRGAPRSRSFDECLRKAREGLAAGYREIVVTGCNIACYEDQRRGLVPLLEALAALPGLGRLRVGSVEPGTVELGVLELMAANEKICRHLHLPLQSGDNGVLQRMGRRYRVEDLISFAAEARALMPDLALGADFICGFPGEDAAAFDNTLRLAERLKCSHLHVFPYSERPGTAACDLDGSVAPEERYRRTRQLIELGRVLHKNFMQGFMGREVAVLIEHFDSDSRARGWSGEYLPCAVEGVQRDAISRLVKARVMGINDGHLQCIPTSQYQADNQTDRPARRGNQVYRASLMAATVVRA